MAITNHRPPGSVPIIGQQQQAAQQAITQAVQQLSLTIYTQAATSYLDSLDTHATPNTDYLKTLAKHSYTAAQAYFEGLGIATFTEPPQ